MHAESEKWNDHRNELFLKMLAPVSDSKCTVMVELKTFTPLRIYLDSEAKTNLAQYSSVLDLRSIVSYKAVVQNVTFYLRVFSYMSVFPYLIY